MKQGEGIVFNWIFIAVVGVLFLLLFIGFAFKYQEVQKEKNNFETATSVDTALEGLQGGNLYAPLTYPEKISVHATCDTFSVNSYQIPLHDKIIFTRSLQSKHFNVWVKDFTFPYKVSALYLLADDTPYYLVGNHSLEIPPLFHVQEISLDDVKHYQGVFIFFGDPGAIKNSVKDYRIILEQEHRVIFPDGNSLPYFGDLVYGAIFAEKEVYACNFKKILGQLQVINTLYMKKASYLNVWTGCPYDLSYFRKVDALLQQDDYQGLIENQAKLQFQNQHFCKEVF